MTGLILENVEKHYGSACAVKDVNLHLPEGKLVCFLGPSGCGKTTLLRMIAGLETLTGGEIRLDGEDIGHTPAHQRNFGMVFQSLALFPHMTVGENIAYPLKLRGVSKADQQARVVELLELIQLQEMIDRPVAKLSGGQRQRVAIARAIASPENPPARRTAVGAGRQVARVDAGGNPSAATAFEHHHHHGHPRPARSHDHG